MIDRLNGCSKKQLCEIYDNLNFWQWDSRLGSKPIDFDDMPNRDKSSNFQKYREIDPYMKAIEKMTTRKQRLKYHHLNNLGHSRLQFEKWWFKRIFRNENKIFK